MRRQPLELENDGHRCVTAGQGQVSAVLKSTARGNGFRAAAHRCGRSAGDRRTRASGRVRCGRRRGQDQPEFSGVGASKRAAKLPARSTGAGNYERKHPGKLVACGASAGVLLWGLKPWRLLSATTVVTLLLSDTGSKALDSARPPGHVVGSTSRARYVFAWTTERVRSALRSVAQDSRSHCQLVGFRSSLSASAAPHLRCPPTTRRSGLRECAVSA